MTAARPRRLEYMDVEELPAAPTNAKRHASTLIDASIDRFGFVEPIVIDERTGCLVSGHGRRDQLRALRDSGKPPPEGVVKGKGGRWMVPVARGWSSTDDSEAEAAGIALNRVGELGGWDEGELAAALQRVSENSSLAGIGYDAGALDEMLKRIAGPHEPGPDTDERADVEQRVSAGDVWELGPHLLMCGDCRNADDVARLVGDLRVNLAVTSPPYAEQRAYDESSGFKPIPPDEYVDWFDAVQSLVAAYLTDDGSWLVNIKPSVDGLDTSLYVHDLVAAHVRRWGWHFATEFCWERIGVPKSPGARLKNQFEPVYQFTRSKWKFRPDNVTHMSAAAIRPDGIGGHPNDERHQGRKTDLLQNKKMTINNTFASSVQGIPGAMEFSVDRIGEGLAYPGNRLPPFMASHEATGHSAAYPVGLPEFFIRLLTDAGDVVLDPFVGSGSTILAAHNAGRFGLAMELSPGYCDIVLDRFERHTGIAPVKRG